MSTFIGKICQFNENDLFIDGCHFYSLKLGKTYSGRKAHGYALHFREEISYLALLVKFPGRFEKYIQNQDLPNIRYHIVSKCSDSGGRWASILVSLYVLMIPF